jgi:hypothetical protein
MTTKEIEFKGTASEALSKLLVVDVASGLETSLPYTVTIESKNRKNWTAKVTLSATEASQQSLRVVGEDLAGNVSTANALGKDRRTVTIDPNSPVLLLTKPTPLLIFTSGNDLFAVQKKLTIEGTLSDQESGVKQVQVGSTVLTPRVATKAYTFASGVTLTEGAVTKVVITGQDNAGNRSAPTTLRAVMKSSIAKLTLSATWSKTAGKLTIAGTTDRAVRLDDGYVAVVPLEITIKLGTQVVRTINLDQMNGTGYNWAMGTFTMSLTDLVNGKYDVTVKAKSPVEFTGLVDQVKKVTVVIQH